MASPFESVEDSPFLRAQLRSLDEGVDELRERTARLSKGCSAYRDGLEDAYANEVNFAESVRAFHGPLDDPFGAQVGASEIDRLLGAFRDIADARGALLSAVETDLCARLETMVSVDLRDATEAKRRFERCSAEHERARAHFLKLTKDAKPETLRLAEADMTQARREHDAARFGLMSRLHEADSRKRVAFKRQIAVAVDAHRAFFERGFRALAELEPFVRQVVARCDAEAEACADDARRLVDAMAAHTAARESETARGVSKNENGDPPGRRAEKAAPQTSLASDRSRAIQTAMHAAETAARADRVRGGSLGGDEDALGDAPGGGSRQLVSKKIDADRADDESSASASSAPARAEGAALPGTPAPFLAQGYLLKRSSSMRADWKRRFFVLDAFGHLGYYRDADVGSLSLRESGEPGPGGSLSRAKDTVSLLTATIKPDLEDAPAMRFCFRVVSPGKTYCLQAESEADRARWMEAITAAVAGLLSNATAIERSVSLIASPPRSRGSSRGHSRAGSFSAAFGFGKSHRRTASAASDGGFDTSFEQVSPESCATRSGSLSIGGPRTFPRATGDEADGASGEIPAPGNAALAAAIELKDTAARNGADPLAVLARVRAPPGNATCADCGAAEPEWASLNLGVTLCIECGGAHRQMGTHVSKVRSCVLDVRAWEHGALVRVFEVWGNTKANALWEARLGEGGEGAEGTGGETGANARSVPNAKPVPASPLAEKTAFVKAKWQDRRWFGDGSHAEGEQDADAALASAAARGDVAGAMAALARGADVETAAEGASGRSRPLRVACELGHDAVAECLLQNGASPDAASGDDGASALHAAVRAGRDATAKLLVRRGASVTSADAKGRTALDAAMDRGSIGDEELFLMLSSSGPNALGGGV